MGKNILCIYLDFFFSAFLSFTHITILPYYLSVLENVYQKSIYQQHRISRKEKDWGLHFFHQIELTTAVEYRASTTDEGSHGRRARSPIAVHICGSTQCREPKTGQEKVQSIVKTIHISYLPIIYLCSVGTSCWAKHEAKSIAKLDLQYSTIIKFKKRGQVMLNILHLRHRTFENLLQKIACDFFLDHVQTIHLCHKSTVAAFTFVDGWKFEEIRRI